MRVVNEALLLEFRMKGRCELCGKARATDPHHVFTRGAGRLDVRCNLLSLCRECHSDTHADHDYLARTLLAAARREGLVALTIGAIVFALRRLPKHPLDMEVERECKGLPENAQKIIVAEVERMRQ